MNTTPVGKLPLRSQFASGKTYEAFRERRLRMGVGGIWTCLESRHKILTIRQCYKHCEGVKL